MHACLSACARAARLRACMCAYEHTCARARVQVRINTSDKELLTLIPDTFVPPASGGTSPHTFDPSIYDGLTAAAPAGGMAVEIT